MTTNITGIPNLKVKPYGGSFATKDAILCEYKKELIVKYAHETINPDDLKNEFCNYFRDWMSSTHKFKGIEDYNIACFSQGTTESFNHFYLRFLNKKRIRIAKGEYFFHSMLTNLYGEDGKFAWLHEDALKQGDVLLVSCPFGDTGNIFPDLENILCTCDDLDIPVFLDFAYLNLAIDFEIDLTHKCIYYISSSLSKVFPVYEHRIGVRFQKVFREDYLSVINEPDYHYTNLMSMYLGLNMMKKFPADWLYKNYKEKQLEMCDHMDLVPSSCVTLGLDYKNKYKEYNRGSIDSNRLCFSRIWDGTMVDGT